MAEKIFADGFRFFERKDNQPEFILGSILVTPETLNKWVNDNPELTSDYQGKRQVKFQIKKSKDGKVYVELDTWKPGKAEPKTLGNDDSSLPF